MYCTHWSCCRQPSYIEVYYCRWGMSNEKYRGNGIVRVYIHKVPAYTEEVMIPGLFGFRRFELKLFHVSKDMHA